MSSTEGFPIENKIYSSFVKMNRLQQLVFDTFSNTSIASATELNIFIDLYSVLKPIFSETFNTVITDYTAITSGLVNMCSHYRAFFRTLSVNTKFYLISSFNTCDINRKFVANYNDKFYRKSQIKLFNEMTNNNLDLLELLCPYLPDIFLIKSSRNYESAVIIGNLIETINDGNPNLIISRDLYPVQLCYKYPYTSYLFPVKSRYGDGSTMLPISEKFNFREEFWNNVEKKINCTSTKPDIHLLSPVNFPLFSALCKFPDRDMTGILSTKDAVKIIDKIVGTEDIKISIEQLYTDPEINSSIPVSLVESRLKALDIDFMLPFYRNDPESKSINLQNLRDDSAINQINAKFFANNPIDLNKL